jgi:NADH-quinone oxidoreductase subunit E
MPYIRALEVATFYTQFQLKPVGTRAHVQVCGTTPCMLRGSEELIAVCRKKIAARPFDRNEAGTLSWEEVECQGACVNAPMVMIFKDTYEDLTPERLEEIIDQFEAGEGPNVPVGPQNGRHLSAPAGGLTTLMDQAEMEAKTREKRAAHHDRPSAPANGAGGEVPTEMGRPNDSTSPTEADQSIVDRETAEGPGSTPAKSRNEAGGQPTRRGEVREETARPAVSGRSSPARTEASSGHNAAGARPAGVEKPAQPDDLKLISGVGPKIEERLHELGIWTFGQIAKWKKAEREWVDEHLRFAGRIERDDWVRQAKALAKGGEEEYTRVFGKKPR